MSETSSDGYPRQDDVTFTAVSAANNFWAYDNRDNWPGPDEIDAFLDAVDAGETRVTDPLTGGQKGTKLARFDLLPADALWALAEHYGKGAEKYEDRNWERGYDHSLTFAAMMRHAWAHWNGEDVDAETGSLHMVAAAWHAVALVTFLLRHAGNDNRPPVSQPTQGLDSGA